MTEKRFILTEQFVTLQGVTFVKDDNAYVDTYYTVGGAVDLLNDYAYENEQLKSTVEEMIKIFDDSGLDYCLSDELEEILND